MKCHNDKLSCLSAKISCGESCAKSSYVHGFVIVSLVIIIIITVVIELFGENVAGRPFQSFESTIVGCDYCIGCWHILTKPADIILFI